MTTRRLPLYLTATALAAFAWSAGGAHAVDENKPSATCGPTKADAVGDSTEPNTGFQSESLDITQAFLKHEPEKGAEATTVNFVIKNLTMSIDPNEGSSSHMWVLKFTSDQPRFVRAVNDYSGATVFEHGVLVTNATGNLPRYEYRGTVPGKFWEGEGGVVQIVIPPDIGGKAGGAIKEVVAEAQSGKTAVPAAGPATPTRGLSYVNDDVSFAAWTIAPTACEGGAAPPTTEAPGTGAPTGPPASGGGGSPTTGTAALPVKLVTTKAAAKKAKKGKTLALKLRSSEPVSGLAIQIRNAKKTFARGKLAKLNGNGTVKIKLKGALKKGKYVVDIVGKDAQGNQRSTAANFTVR